MRASNCAAPAALLLAVSFAAGCVAGSPPSPRPSPGSVSVTTGDGVRLAARVLGSGSDTVLIPLASGWGREVEPLASGRTVIFYDPRSRGASQRVTDPARLGMEQDIADAEAVRAHFGSPRVALVGWSYFGALAARYAARHPHAVTRLVMVAPVPPRSGAYPRPSPPRMREPDASLKRAADSLASAAARGADPAGHCRALYRLELAELTRSDTSLQALRSDPCVHPNEWPDSLMRTLSATARERQSYDWRAEAQRIRSPALVIMGTNDINPPASAHDWAAQVKGRVLEVPDAGPLIQHEAPRAVLDAVDRFLRER